MLFPLFLCALGFVVFLAWYVLAEDPVVRRRVGLCSILAIAGASALSLYPISQTVKLGLDLKGGTAFLIALDGQPSSSAREKAMQVIRKRVDQFGLSEPIIQPIGSNRISVQIPGLSEKQKDDARQQLSKVAKLEFRLVHPQNRDLLNAFHSGDAGAIPIDYEILPYVLHDLQGKEIRTEIVVKRRPEMSGKYVQRAFRSFDEVGRATVVIEFTPAGQEVFGRVTSNCVGQQMAIVLDREVQSAPEIKTAIFNNATISGGNMTPTEADDLSSVLENPLETPVKLLEERGVDPSLGRDSIISGRNASLVAVVTVMAFMILYYRWAGLIASVGMILNLFMLFGMLAQFHFTLTLPGIAGIVLTIGMAVDANVLIYERIRDELAAGKPLRAAVSAGFARAFSAIFDAHITTIIPAIILLVLGSGPLQGFAVTLTLGIVANLFAALVVTKNAFEWLLSFPGLDRLTMLQAVRNPRLDFIKIGRVASVFSIALLIWGVAAFAAHRHALLGVDFAGGDAVTLTSAQSPLPSIAEVRGTLDRAGIQVGTLQYAAASVANGQKPQLLVQTRYGQGEKVAPALAAVFPQAGYAQAGLERVGPIVGKELARRALLTLGMGLIGIMVYVAFRYEWSFSLAATLGQVHDVLIAIGVMALLGREFNMTLIGAFLTILGYSINDKIVISDRIRESWRAGELKSFYDIINRGLNLTLARTLMTGGTVILAVLSLLFFGGRVISDFALAMLIGILAGVFSSHFLTPWLLEWFHGMAEGRPRRPYVRHVPLSGSGAASNGNGSGSRSRI